MKTISVIIPTYNRSPHLQRLLQLLLEQTEPPDEIIVVDDHSTDNTEELVRTLAATHPRIMYVRNKGRYQRDGKATGLEMATGQYLGFLDDDVLIHDHHFFKLVRSHLSDTHVVQTKVILEQMGQRNEPQPHWRDRLTTRPYPILELLTARLNGGSTPRHIFPLIEFGNFWSTRLKHLFIDENLILDGYGESYASALRLTRAGIPIIHVPRLVIRHPGADTGGSKRFDKRRMTAGFTKFHYGYFTNMIYLHARYFPGWVWMWLPFYLGKACAAVAINHDLTGFRANAVRPLVRAVWKFWVRRLYV